MTESEITAFLSIVQYGSISAAAQKLFISQPALSRRIYSLEEELGCKLFERGKGQRYIELTEAGKNFISLAHRWQQLLAESAELATHQALPRLKVGSVGSVCNLLLPPVIEGFMKRYPECRLQVYQYHSVECYDNMEQGTLDFALISDDVFSKNVETVPAFRSHFYLLTQNDYGSEQQISPAILNPNQEIRIPWTPEYDLWHDYWFGSTAIADLDLDQMMLLEYFLCREGSTNWALVPAYVMQRFSKHAQLKVYILSDPPPDEIIYYLLPKDASKLNSYGQKLLPLLKETLSVLHPELTMLL